MASTDNITFGSFRLDTIDNSLWNDEQRIDLQARPLAVLRYLAEHPGQLVTKEELLDTVWAGTHVSKTTLKVCIRNVREALGEVPSTPHYIETVGREGYRFIGAGEAQMAAQRLHTAQANNGLTAHIVGRNTEIEQLHRWFQLARDGRRQVVFVTGEPGIGKTTLVDQFIDRLQTEDSLWLGRGQCIEQYGSGEPYRPVLEALEQLGRERDGTSLIAGLAQYAPTWLAQLPSLVSTEQLATLQPRVQGANRERMLREMAEALEALTARRDLVIVLEDLHWSDTATLDLISSLAQRRRNARLLILATYRPVDVAVSNHPLRGAKQVLQSHHLCEELPLELLTQKAVGTYLQQLFSSDASVDALAHQIYQRSDGNPLFMANILSYCFQQDLIDEVDGQWVLTGPLETLGVPENLRQLIAKQIEALPAESQRVLEVASVVGAEFSGAAVAVGLRADPETIDEVCEDLAWKRHFVSEDGLAEWPDHTISGQYGFRHALYQNVLYDRIGEARRVRLHRAIGERLEVAYGEQATELAHELALHFERGRETARAIPYRLEAGRMALRKSAYPEVIMHVQRGLEALAEQPESPQRHGQELQLQMTMALPLMATKGYGASEVGTLFIRARELCKRLGDPPQLFPIMYGHWGFYFVSGQFAAGQEIAAEFLQLAEEREDPALLLQGHRLMAGTFVFYGDFLATRSHAEHALALYDPALHQAQAAMYGQEPGMASGAFLSIALWALGYPDQALDEMLKAYQRVEEMTESHQLSVAYATAFVSMLYLLRRNWPQARDYGEATAAICEPLNIPLFLSAAFFQRGLAVVMQSQGKEGLSQMRQGFELHQTTGTLVNKCTYFGWLAEAYLHEGQLEDGLNALDKAFALVATTGEGWYESELHRLQGALLLEMTQRPNPNVNDRPATSVADAETCFQLALEIARRQEAKSFELRAATSLSRLWWQQNKRQDAYDLLAPIYEWFTEGFDTEDLKDATALLQELGR